MGKNIHIHLLDAGFDESKVKRDEGGKFSEMRRVHARKLEEHREAWNKLGPGHEKSGSHMIAEGMHIEANRHYAEAARHSAAGDRHGLVAIHAKMGAHWAAEAAKVEREGAAGSPPTHPEAKKEANPDDELVSMKMKGTGEEKLHAVPKPPAGVPGGPKPGKGPVDLDTQTPKKPDPSVHFNAANAHAEKAAEGDEKGMSSALIRLHQQAQYHHEQAGQFLQLANKASGAAAALRMNQHRDHVTQARQHEAAIAARNKGAASARQTSEVAAAMPKGQAPAKKLTDIKPINVTETLAKLNKTTPEGQALRKGLAAEVKADRAAKTGPTGSPSLGAGEGPREQFVAVDRANELQQDYNESFERKASEWAPADSAASVPAASLSGYPEFTHKEVYGHERETSPAGSDFTPAFTKKGHVAFILKHPDGQRHVVHTTGSGYARYHAAISEK